MWQKPISIYIFFLFYLLSQSVVGLSLLLHYFPFSSPLPPFARFGEHFVKWRQSDLYDFYIGKCGRMKMKNYLQEYTQIYLCNLVCKVLITSIHLHPLFSLFFIFFLVCVLHEIDIFSSVFISFLHETLKLLLFLQSNMHAYTFHFLLASWSNRLKFRFGSLIRHANKTGASCSLFF